jgi:5-methylcytosine-specific restriction endonuclease McrA
MEIEKKNVIIRELINNYQDKGVDGIRGYNEKLNIRPKYQREFIYKSKQEQAVIETILRDFPLNTIYWIKNADDTYEVLDGQQRIISICRFINNEFSIEYEKFQQIFDNLQPDIQNKILDYKLFVYVCKCTDSERLNWFRIINIAGEILTNQELLNATYTGKWLSDAKEYFSKPNGEARGLGKNYIEGDLIRQRYLEEAIKWISDNKIDEYMSKHQHDENSNELRDYFTKVINWTKNTFRIDEKQYNKYMKGVDWGKLYKKYHNGTINQEEIKQQVEKLILDDEIKNKKGIFEYILSHNEKTLNLRTFSDQQKQQKYAEQKGVCPMCKKENRTKTNYELNEMEADHITPWSKGGKTTLENCQMLCQEHNRTKSNK